MSEDVREAVWRSKAVRVRRSDTTTCAGVAEDLPQQSFVTDSKSYASKTFSGALPSGSRKPDHNDGAPPSREVADDCLPKRIVGSPHDSYADDDRTTKLVARR